MNRGIKPDLNCPIISQNLLKSGAIHHLLAKYLHSFTLISCETDKIPFFPDFSLESFQIANELVLKYLQRFDLKFTSDTFRIESNLKFSNPNLPIKRLKLTYSQDPLKHFLKIIEKSPKLKFHDTLAIQSLLLRVPNLIDEDTKSHFINILKKAGNFQTSDEKIIYSIIQKNQINYNNNNFNRREPAKKISQSEPPKPPQELSGKNYSPPRKNLTQKKDVKKQKEANRSASSSSFKSSSSNNLKDGNPQSVVAQITKTNRHYSCNLIGKDSESDSISESNLQRGKPAAKQVFSISQSKKKDTKKDANNNCNNNNAKNSNFSEYANSSSSYFYEYETISEPEQPHEANQESQSSAKSEIGILIDSSSSDKPSKEAQKKNPPVSQTISSEAKPNNYSKFATEIRPGEKMSLVDQLQSFELKKEDLPLKPSSSAQNKPLPSPHVYRLTIPEDNDDFTVDKYKKNKQKSSKSSQKQSKASQNSKTTSKSAQEVRAKIDQLEKELKALSSDKESESYSSEQENSKISQLQQTLANAVKESSTLKRSSRAVSSSDDDDNYKNTQNKQKIPSKTSFSSALLEQKKTAKPSHHHHSKPSRSNGDEASTTTREQSKEQSKKPVVLKSSDNQARIRTISEQKKIDKSNEKNKVADSKNSISRQKSKEPQPKFDNQPETFILSISEDPYKSLRADAKIYKETLQYNKQNQKQSSSQKTTPPHKSNQVQKSSQSARQAQTQKKIIQPKSNIASSDELISDSPPPAMRQLWESKNKNESRSKSNTTTATPEKSVKTSPSKEKSKNNELLKASNQNSSSSLYDAFVDLEKKEKTQQNQSKKQTSSTTNSATKEMPKKQEEARSSRQNTSQPKLENTKSANAISVKHQLPNESSTISTSSKQKQATSARPAATSSSSMATTSASKYTNHPKTASSMSASKYTNHSQAASTIDSNLNQNKQANSKYTSHANLRISESEAPKAKPETTSQKQEYSSTMKTLQIKNRSDNHSVEPKKFSMTQRYLELGSQLSSSEQSESFRIPLQKTRIFRAKMLSDLSEVDFDDSSSSISERRRLPPLKVEIPYHDGHARAFKNYYDFLSSSENFDLDDQSGRIKKKIKEKLLKRSSSVIPTSFMPKRSATSTSVAKENDNLGLKRSSTSNRVLNNQNAVSNNKPNEDSQQPKTKLSISVRTGSENTTANPNASNVSNTFVAHITVVESEKLSRVDTFFVLYIENSNQAKRTKTVKGKTSSKQFNESFDFTITKEKCNIVIQAKKEDLINGDQNISSAKLNLMTLPLHKRNDKWVPLNTYGRVRLVMTLEKDNSKPSNSSQKPVVQNQPQTTLKVVTGSSNTQTSGNSKSTTSSNTQTSNSNQISNSRSNASSSNYRSAASGSTQTSSGITNRSINNSSKQANNEKDSAVFTLRNKNSEEEKRGDDELKLLLKMTDEKKNADPLLKSLVKSMSETKTLDIEEPTVNVPLLSESSSSDYDSRSGDKNEPKRKSSKGKTRSKSRSRSRKTKK